MNSSVTWRQRDLGDVQLVLGDQAEQQVERALEVVEVHLEAVAAAEVVGGLGPAAWVDVTPER